MKHFLIILFTLVLAAFGQTTSTATLPSTWGVGIGGEVTAYNSPLTITPTISIMGCWTALCEISTFEMNPTIASVRQELAYKAKESSDGNRMLLILVGGGLTATQAPGSLMPSTLNLGNVGGGFAFVQDLGQIVKPLKGTGVKFKLSARESAVTSLGVKPQYQAELVYRFK